MNEIKSEYIEILKNELDEHLNKIKTLDNETLIQTLRETALMCELYLYIKEAGGFTNEEVEEFLKTENFLKKFSEYYYESNYDDIWSNEIIDVAGEVIEEMEDNGEFGE